MDIQKKISRNFQTQHFEPDDDSEKTHFLKTIAFGYAVTENAIAVLSDLRENKSYICYGGIAELLGIADSYTNETVNSIWERKIYDSIHKDDLSKKHINELRFYNFIKNLPPQKREGFFVKESLRMFSKEGKLIPVTHRMYYFYENGNSNIRFSLCLYNLRMDDEKEKSYILNSINPKSYILDNEYDKQILSEREKEILRLIEKGMSSIDISNTLSISKNTVNRHRQNILEKLQAKNSVEACKIAKEMRLII